MLEPTLISTAPPLPPPPPAPSKKKYLWFLILIPICCLCIAAIAVGGYFYVNSQPINIGYYEMESGIGSGDSEQAIITAGYTPVPLEGLAAEDISGLHVLFILNSDNHSYSSYYMDNLPVIEAAVRNGMVLVIHDRTVVSGTYSADQILPGGSEIEFFRDPGSEVQIVDFENSVIDGPGGILNDDSLDGGSSSVHGYANIASLPANTKVILATANPDQAVLFWYKLGSGIVIYSSIPLDYYIESADSEDTGTVGYNFKFLYTPNVIKFAGEKVSFFRHLLAR